VGLRRNGASPRCETLKTTGHLTIQGFQRVPLAHTRQVPGAFIGELRPPTLVNSQRRPQSKEKAAGRRTTHKSGLAPNTCNTDCPN
jgi:hypothetical protein